MARAAPTSPDVDIRCRIGPLARATPEGARRRFTEKASMFGKRGFVSRTTRSNESNIRTNDRTSSASMQAPATPSIEWWRREYQKQARWRFCNSGARRTGTTSHTVSMLQILPEYVSLALAAAKQGRGHDTAAAPAGLARRAAHARTRRAHRVMLRIGRLTRDEQPGAPLDPPGCAGASCHHAARQGDICFRLHNVLVVGRAPSAADIPVGRSHARQGAQQSSHMVVAAIANAFAAMSGAGGGRRETQHDGARHPNTAATLAQPQKYHAKHWKALMYLQRHARNSKQSGTLWSEGAKTDERAGYSAGPNRMDTTSPPARRQSQLIKPSPHSATGPSQTSAATNPLGRVVQTADKSPFSTTPDVIVDPANRKKYRCMRVDRALRMRLLATRLVAGSKRNSTYQS